MTWQARPLGSVAVIQGGIQKQQKRAPVNNRFPFLRVANVTAQGLDLSDVHEIELFGDEESRYELQRDDLLVVEGNGSRSQIGRAALWDGSIPRAVHQNHLIRVRAGEDLLPRFLALVWRSESVRRQLESVASSTSGLHTLSVSKLKRVEIPVPPPIEQQRIVEIVEDHLSHLDAADVALAQSARRVLAFQRSLLDRTCGLDAAETAVALGDLVASIRAGKSFGGSSGPAAADEWGIIKVSAMTWGEFDPSQNKAVPSERVDPRNEIRPGDLLVSRANTSEYVGASVLVGDVRPRLLLSDKSLRIEPKAGVERTWLWRALQAPSARRQISALATGTKDSMRNISQGALLSVKVPRVAAEQQVAAVRQFTQATDGVKPLETAIRQQRLRGAALRRAVLAAAFQGRLTGASSDADIIEEMADV